jgi:glycerol-3-phosphate dehydrogenase
MVTREWARTTDDILWRRSKLGLHFTPDEIAALAEQSARLVTEARLADAEYYDGRVDD